MAVRVIRTESDIRAPGIAGGVFVPTMGALHEGHAALVREAARLKSARGLRAPVIVSIFVNPTQFNDRADLARYPRTLEADVARCAAAGAEVIFAPDERTVYPPDRPIAVPPLPPVATRPGLEDAHRPGHFAGVCQVVARLFDLVRPVVAVFGEKDWQQLQVIRQMTASAGASPPIEIVGLPTVREPDGLAMSSRNVFLTADERPRARAVPRALAAGGALRAAADAESTMREVLEAAGLGIDYAVVRDAATLLPLGPGSSPAGARALIAARLGSIRLIDNAPWPSGA